MRGTLQHDSNLMFEIAILSRSKSLISTFRDGGLALPGSETRIDIWGFLV